MALALADGVVDLLGAKSIFPLAFSASRTGQQPTLRARESFCSSHLLRLNESSQFARSGLQQSLGCLLEFSERWVAVGIGIAKQADQVRDVESKCLLEIGHLELDFVLCGLQPFTAEPRVIGQLYLDRIVLDLLGIRLLNARFLRVGFCEPDCCGSANGDSSGALESSFFSSGLSMAVASGVAGSGSFFSSWTAFT